ncbi:MAG: hypothetical protein M0R80_13345 [Proteobacteria bacterium]|jgi:hypothetical protein|nr:hypothetical protein [Pseudomonadota bacterium]
MKTIYVDLDGVIVDLVQGILNKQGITSFHWPKGEYNIEKTLGTNCLRDMSIHDWATLPMTLDAKRIMNIICDYDVKVILCSKPYNETSAAGKWLWWQTSQFAGFPLILTDMKSILVNKDTLLIDDSELECVQWQQNDGNCILLPRPWNYLYNVNTITSLESGIRNQFHV